MNNINLLYVDLFCGAGGTSTGVESARINGEQCAKIIACVNHDTNAIASHAANHPEAMHFTEDIRTLELSALVAHVQRMKQLYPDAHLVLWASLECTNFSKAKGGQPRDADSRTLAEHLFVTLKLLIQIISRLKMLRSLCHGVIWTKTESLSAWIKVGYIKDGYAT